MIQGGLKALLALVIVFNSVGAFAAAPQGIDHPCAASKELSMKERDSFIGFHARLSHLQAWYGKKAFEIRLNDIIQKYWPKLTVIEISPFYYEKVLNLIDQARLRNSIALTIGIENDAWLRFEKQMKAITVFGMTGGDGMNPLDKVATNLVKTIGAAKRPSKDISDNEWEIRRAEALARTVEMNTYLLRWKALNSDIMDERAAIAAKKLAILGISMVGGAVLVGTLVLAAPAVMGAGAIGAGLSTNPVVSTLLMKVAETAAGSALGFVGAPAAILVQDSYLTVAKASANSLNNQSSFSCELSKQMGVWQQQGPGRLLSASLIGAGMGAGGGFLTFSGKSAKLVLYATGLGVAIAQAYALGKMTQEAVATVALYRLAEEAAEAGQNAQAKEYLIQARAMAIAAGDHGLEAIIVATLSYHVAGHFRQALHEGAGAIRQLYAASADTLPTAANAAGNMIPMGGKLPQFAEAKCDPKSPNYAACVAENGMASR